MVNLIKKDFILSKKINIFAVIYSFFIAAMGAYSYNYIISTLFYISGIVMIVVVFTMYANGYDDKYKSEMILNSLPIDRKNIVRSKYLILILFTIVACGIVYLFTKSIFLLNYIEVDKSLNIQAAIIVMNIILLFYSIYYPFYFKIGEGMKTFNTILWISVILSPNLMKKGIEALERQGLLESILNIDIGIINIFILGFSLIIYYVSLQISKGIYIKKDF